ncbi:MAG: hypothetical protein ABIQ86_09960 [Steroidobacteraceae bacterium]
MRLIRKLDLAAGTGPGRSPWLSAASGLVRTADEFCVVADDELHLGRFTLDLQRPGRLLRLFPGALPAGMKKRKKRKPDVEVLLRLPASAGIPYGALLALGSGSGVHRRRGALLALSAGGRVVGRARGIDAEQLFTRLSRSFADLNLEGGWVAGNRLHLLQRGNKGNSRNALLQWELKPLLRCLLRERSLPDSEPVEVREFDLGDIHGVPLCFTDASPLLQGGSLFSATAENAANSYVDGPCLGSAIGRMDARLRIRWIRPVHRQCKVEGIDVQQEGARLRAWLVTDADDPRVPASLLQWDG